MGAYDVVVMATMMVQSTRVDGCDVVVVEAAGGVSQNVRLVVRVDELAVFGDNLDAVVERASVADGVPNAVDAAVFADGDFEGLAAKLAWRFEGTLLHASSDHQQGVVAFVGRHVADSSQGAWGGPIVLNSNCCIP